MIVKFWKYKILEPLLLAEAVELWALLSQFKKPDSPSACGEKNWEGNILSARELLDVTPNIYGFEGPYRFTGYNTYAARKTQDQGLELALLGGMNLHGDLPSFLKDAEKARSEKELFKLQRRFGREAIKTFCKYYAGTSEDFEGQFKIKLPTEKTSAGKDFIPPEGTLALAFDGDQKTMDDFLEAKNAVLRTLEKPSSGIRYTPTSGNSSVEHWEYFDREWRLAFLGNGYTSSVFSIEPPTPRTSVIFQYSGDELPHKILFDHITKPTDLGNGVVVIARDRIPLYLQRTLGLGGKL